jgi:multiple sugar transport system permease protein
MSFLAAMQSIPEENYEAAEMDGAAGPQQFWYITLPYLRNISMVTVSLLFMWTANDFSSQYLLTGGGPGSSSLTMAVEAYYQGFRSGNFGMAAAYGNVMILFCGVFLFFYIRALRQKEYT